MNYIKSFINRVKDAGLWNAVIGTIKYIYYLFLYRRFHFSKWNVSPYEHRPYIQKIANVINSDRNIYSVADIGCGIGELLRNLNCTELYGYDINYANIMAAEFLDKKNRIHYMCGTFDDISGMKFDCLVSVNFPHGDTEEYWKPIYHRFLQKNDVKKLIVDVHPEKLDPIMHKLNFRKILPDKYKLVNEFGPFYGGIMIQKYEVEIEK